MAFYDYVFILTEAGTEELYHGTDQVIWSVNIVPDAPPSGYGEDDYRFLLASLLPQGAAWPRDPQSTLQKLLAALAADPARVDERAGMLLAESDPRSTSELLGDWERVAGLPDPCVVAPQTVQERRAALEARITSTGGQSPAFYIQVAARLGYSITIDEFRPFQAGSNAGDPLTNGEAWAHTWRVNAPAQTVREFRVGEATVGEALRTWGNEILDCALQHRLKPAHTNLLIAYA